MTTMSIHTTALNPDADQPFVPEGLVRLRPLLTAAGSTELDGREGWTGLLGATHQVTADLVARGELPAHLMVAPDDPRVLATRTIAAAWRYVARAQARLAGC